MEVGNQLLYAYGKSLCFTLDVRLEGPKNQSGHGGEEKILFPLLFDSTLNFIFKSINEVYKYISQYKQLKQVNSSFIIIHVLQHEDDCLSPKHVFVSIKIFYVICNNCIQCSMLTVYIYICVCVCVSNCNMISFVKEYLDQ
jgi:hypothetical protein